MFERECSNSPPSGTVRVLRGSQIQKKCRIEKARDLKPRAARLIRFELGLRKFEVYRNLRLHLDRFAIQVVGFVLPLSYGFHRCASQNRLSTQLLDLGRAASLGNIRLQLDS